jgi:hypothetical protein
MSTHHNLRAVYCLEQGADLWNCLEQALAGESGYVLGRCQPEADAIVLQRRGTPEAVSRGAFLAAAADRPRFQRSRGLRAPHRAHSAALPLRAIHRRQDGYAIVPARKNRRAIRWLGAAQRIARPN